ncbi:iron ABC transporter ATP-binding protein [Agromyces silvae]|uniref:iron ABC transporter ATP-binding protein n=1 Tax=Agromyces silvae TaxID=3388266 RepID=UPI00280B1C83|nr:iron ABC transporter ATP-binding protein [Agromyces protaetiae]
MLRSDRSSRAALIWIALGASTAALLAGCAPGEAEPTASPSPTSSATSAPTPEPTETTEPDENATPFTIDCDALLTLDQLYVFNPNFGVDPSYEPDSATISEVVAQGGTACGYLNQTSGDHLQIAVATPTPAAIESLAGAAASQSTPVPTYGTPPEVEGYFAQSGNEGQVQVFSGPYWVVIESSLLYEPGDAEQLVTDVRGNLPAA